MNSIPFFSELSPMGYVTLFGGTATLLAALINLRIHWRKEVLNRLETSRQSKKSRRGLALAIVFLVLTAAVAGYGSALYMMERRQDETEAMRTELKARIAQIQSTAERLEQARLGETSAIEAQWLRREEGRRGAEGVTASIVVPACRLLEAKDGKTESGRCSEADAVKLAVCATVPGSASVTDVVPFARFEGDTGAWAERRAAAGADLGGARFEANPFERADGNLKQVCLGLVHWQSVKSLEARILVRYSLPDAAGLPAASAAVVRQVGAAN